MQQFGQDNVFIIRLHILQYVGESVSLLVSSSSVLCYCDSCFLECSFTYCLSKGGKGYPNDFSLNFFLNLHNATEKQKKCWGEI